MENIYIDGDTQRQASTKIRKILLPAIATNRHAAVGNLIERLFTFSASCPPENQIDEVMTNTLVHCVQHMPWARPLRHALNSTTVSDFEDACSTLSAPATGNRERHFGYHWVPRRDSSANVSFSNESTCIFQSTSRQLAASCHRVY
jgi:hypothetical protein